MPRRRPKPPGTTSQTDLEARFVAEYLIDLNATQAYLRATHHTVTEGTARTAGSRMLAKANVNEAVAAGKQRQLAKAELTATTVLQEIGRIAMFDPADLFDANGKLLPIHRMPKHARVALSGLEVARANLDKTDGKQSKEWLHKVRFRSKEQALQMLAEHFKLLVQAESAEGDWDKLAARLRSARRRAGEPKRFDKAPARKG